MSRPSNNVKNLYRVRFGDYDRERKILIWQALVKNFFQDRVRRSWTVLDLGCGYGEFLNSLECARRIGVDINPESEIFLDKGVEFHQRSATDLLFIEDGSIDFVFTSNLLEHLAGKKEIEQMLEEVFRVLRIGGIFVALGPNIRFLPGEYWDFWDHMVPISDRSLAEVLQYVGFEVTESVARFLPYSSRSVLPVRPFLIRWYLGLPVVWRMVGKQFLITAVKPDRQ